MEKSSVDLVNWQIQIEGRISAAECLEPHVRPEADAAWDVVNKALQDAGITIYRITHGLRFAMKENA